MEIADNIVVVSEEYDRIDGRNAYHSDIKRLTVGMPVMEEYKNMQIAMQIWKEKEDGTLSIAMELPIHHIMDFMLLLSRTMLYFREAYRHPLLYNPDNPVIERIGVQGAVMQKLVWKKPATRIESHAEHRICEEVKRNWTRGEMKITNILLEGGRRLRENPISESPFRRFRSALYKSDLFCRYGQVGYFGFYSPGAARRKSRVGKC